MSSKPILSLLSSGSNSHGQLGSASLDDSRIFQPCSFADHPLNTLPSGTSQVLEVATGANHTLLLLEMTGNKRELWGCGDGRKGQLGQKYQHTIVEGGSTTLFLKLDLALEDVGLGSYRFKLISATWETSYVVLSCEGKKDVVISMGSDDYGDLGIGGLKGKKPTTDFHIVQFDHIPSLSETLKVRAMHSGQRHIILYTTSSSSSILLGWGTSRHGQLGSHASTPFASTPQIIITEIDLANDPVTSIALGIHHSVILQESGRLSCHGSDRKGQLQVVKTLPPEAGRIQNIGCTWNGTYVVVQSEGRWNVYSSGSNSHSQLGWNSNGTTSVDVVGFPVTADAHRTAINLACGSEHVLALVTPNPAAVSQAQSPHVWGWGWNEHGNLGMGHTDDVPTPVRLWPPPGDDEKVLNVRGIWAGSGTSWICATVTPDLQQLRG